MLPYKYLIINTDGASRGNPGPAAAGVTIRDDKGQMLRGISRYLGRLTCNQAEYQALIMALEEARRIGAAEVRLLADSELLVKQLKREYRVKNEGLAVLFTVAVKLLAGFARWNVRYIPREQNKEADRLANEALDKAGFKKIELTLGGI